MSEALRAQYSKELQNAPTWEEQVIVARSIYMMSHRGKSMATAHLGPEDLIMRAKLTVNQR